MKLVQEASSPNWAAYWKERASHDQLHVLLHSLNRASEPTPQQDAIAIATTHLRTIEDQQNVALAESHPEDRNPASNSTLPFYLSSLR